MKLDYIKLNENDSFGLQNDLEYEPSHQYTQDKLDTLITQVQSLVNTTTAQKMKKNERHFED